MMKEFLINSQDDYSHFFYKLFGILIIEIYSIQLSYIILGLASHTNSNTKTDSGNSVIYLQQQEARISKKTLKQNEMPFITLKNRCESTAPVITQSMAEMVKNSDNDGDIKLISSLDTSLYSKKISNCIRLVITL
jgi:hypothetical protein